MRIVLLSTGHPTYDRFPDGGGIQYHISGLALEFARLGHQVHIICRSADRRLFKEDGIEFHVAPNRLPDEILSVFAFSRKAASIIDSLEPEVVSAFERFSAYFPSLTRYPMTFTTENYDGFRYYRRSSIEHNLLNALVFPWKRRVEEGIMRRSRLVIALNQSIRRYLESIGINHLEVIPNAVHAANYRNSGDGGYILYAGRLDSPKRVDVLIESYSHLSDLQRDYDLVIVGKGPLRERLMKFARDLGVSEHVRFKNWASQEDLDSLLGRCSVFVLPSDFETFGITLLQAMASSKAVIGSDTTGPGDIITNQRDGLLFTKGSVKSLAESLRTCLEDGALRQELGRQARLTVENQYDFSMVSHRTLSLYANLN